MVSAAAIAHKVFVAGSTGATGKHVVKLLLERGDTQVVAMARSKEKLMGVLDLKEGEDSNLVVKEASIGNLSLEELKKATEGCSAVVSCLGHNLTFKGLFREAYFVSDAAKNLSLGMPENSRFVLMSTVGFPHPKDPIRSRFERGLMAVLRYLMVPVRDNEKSAYHLLGMLDNKSTADREWVAVRPGDLYNEEDEPEKKPGYEIFDQASGPLFDMTSMVSRTDVARFMSRLATMESKTFRENHNHKMPVIFGAKQQQEEKAQEL